MGVGMGMEILVLLAYDVIIKVVAPVQPRCVVLDLRDCRWGMAMFK